MKCNSVRMLTICVLAVGLTVLTACPNGAPSNPILTHLIVGDWTINGQPAQFNDDGTFSIDANNLTGTYELLSKGILLTQDGSQEPTHSMALIGFRAGRPVFTDPLFVAIHD